MVLAVESLSDRIMEMVSDQPWPGCRVEVGGVGITWMSSAIFSILLTTGVLLAVFLTAARKHKRPEGPSRWQRPASGSANLIEVLVVFVRDMIARPALHDRAYEHLPFLMTLFVFVLGMNLLGIVPLDPLARVAHLPGIGHTATSIPTVCGALASLAMLKVVLTGLAAQASRFRASHRWPAPVCYAVSPLLWLLNLAPPVPGVVGKILLVPLAFIELIGAAAKGLALMIRLCANMLSGHTLLALMLIFVFRAVQAWLEAGSPYILVVGPAAIAGSLAFNLLELLVAGLQAYILTLLTAMFLGLYGGQAH